MLLALLDGGSGGLVVRWGEARELGRTARAVRLRRETTPMSFPLSLSLSRFKKKKKKNCWNRAEMLCSNEEERGPVRP
ncbi:hypothetical protein Sjap_005327 [Stephania japonica]|uniref:Uncharacterized protein n=1 Tax=Stephania japonica TaxID=461633 RepID=A0AAP0K5A6_9MAGN